MRSSFPVAHGLVAVAGLLGVANAQGLYGTPAGQVGFPTCSAFPIRYLGCFVMTQAILDDLAPFGLAPYNPAPPLLDNESPNYDPGSNFDATLTPSECSTQCRNFGFKYSIIFDYICRCAPRIPLAGIGAQAAGACNLPCPGDATQTCGGGAAADLYIDPSFPDNIPTLPVGAGPFLAPGQSPTVAASYQYLGCYRTTGFTSGEAVADGTLDPATEYAGRLPSVTDCQARCAGLGYPLFAARRTLAVNNFIECRCGTSFNAGSYRLRGPEYTQSPGDCTINCATGTTDCNPALGPCCGAQNSYPVYINPELQGCYTPIIPGFKDGDFDPTFDCYDVPAALRGPPRTLPQAVVPAGAQLASTRPALIRQPSVASPGGTFYFYGCFPGIASTLLSTVINIATGPASLEACATACAASAFPLPFMAIAPGGGCFCGSGLLGDPAADIDGAGDCNTPCTFNTALACGGPGHYQLYVNRLTDRPAYDSYSATYLATPTPTYSCGLAAVAPTSTTTATQVTTTYITQVVTTSIPVTVSNNITIFGETTYTTTLPVTQTVGTFTETRTILETATVTTPYLATITWTTQGSTVTSVVTSSTTYVTTSTRFLRGPPRTITETRDGVVRTTTVTGGGPPVISDPPSNPPAGRDCFGPRGCTLSLRFGLMRFPQTEPGEVCSIVTRSWVLGATELLPSATLPAIGEASDAARVAGPEEIEPVVGAVTDEPEEDEPEPEIGSISEDPDTTEEEPLEEEPLVEGEPEEEPEEADVPVGVPIAPVVPGAGAEDPEVLPENLPEQL